VEVKWIIPHPGTLEAIDVESFEVAMSKWYEGFNVPRMVLDGVVEDFSVSHARLMAYRKNACESV